MAGPENLTGPAEGGTPQPKRTSFLGLWTVKVFFTMLTHFMVCGHLVTFTALWVVFLSTPVDPGDRGGRSFLAFSGGVGLRPPAIGLAMSLTASFSILAQMVFYPLLQDRFSTVRIWRYSLLFFPVAYLIAPFPALIASMMNSARTTSLAVWALIAVELIMFSIGRTGVVPATTLLINDCVPAPDARGTINTLGTVVGNLSRTIFPMVALGVFGLGLSIGIVGLGFWFLVIVAALSNVASLWIEG